MCVCVCVGQVSSPPRGLAGPSSVLAPLLESGHATRLGCVDRIAVGREQTRCVAIGPTLSTALILSNGIPCGRSHTSRRSVLSELLSWRILDSSCLSTSFSQLSFDRPCSCDTFARTLVTNRFLSGFSPLARFQACTIDKRNCQTRPGECLGFVWMAWGGDLRAGQYPGRSSAFCGIGQQHRR